MICIRPIIALCCAVVLVESASAQSPIRVTFEAGGVTSSKVSSATVEGFETIPLGTYSSNTPYTNGFGTYTPTGTNSVSIVAADQYSGAGDSRSIVIAASSSATLALSNTGGVGYFGIYITAIDGRSNQIDFYKNNVKTFSFNAGDIVTSGKLTGTPGVAGGHYGKPDGTNKNANANEAYVYVNFFANTTADKFDKIVFSQGLGGRFESDNHAVFDSLIAQGTQTGTVFTPVPEPSGLLVVAAVLFGLAMRVRGWVI